MGFKFRFTLISYDHDDEIVGFVDQKSILTRLNETIRSLSTLKILETKDQNHILRNLRKNINNEMARISLL